MLNLKNTLDGYLKNVEVIGNTIQDTNNLADIRSVGDKVEGQELYKIDVVSRGKNLFNIDLDFKNPQNLVVNRIHQGIEITRTNGGAYQPIHFPINLKRGNYYFNFKKTAGIAVYFRFFHKGSQVIQVTKSGVITFDCDVDELVILNEGVNTPVQLTDMQIEEGTQATSYEPYQEQKLEILSSVQLEKVGDVADRIICKDGVWGVEKNIKTYVFNGTENIKFWNGTIDQPNTCAFFCEQLFEDAYIDHLKINAISNMFTSYINATELNHVDKEGFSVNSTVYFRCLKSNANTVDEFKKYIKNLYIKYQTNNPTFISLPHDQQVKLRTFAGQTNIAFLTEIPGQIKAQVPKSLGAVVNTHTEQIEMLHNALKSVLSGDMYSLATILYPEDFEQNDNTEQDIMVIPE